MQKSLQRKTGQLFDTLNQVSVTLAQVTHMIDRITPSQGCEPCVVLLPLELDADNSILFLLLNRVEFVDLVF